jgi:hypothetical protein
MLVEIYQRIDGVVAAIIFVGHTMVAVDYSTSNWEKWPGSVDILTQKPEEWPNTNEKLKDSPFYCIIRA